MSAAPARLDDAALGEQLGALASWSLDPAASVGTLVRTVRFAGWLETIAFVNALAWICHRADHHPDLAIGHRTASIRFTTHSSGGLTELDVRLARHVDALLAETPAAG